MSDELSLRDIYDKLNQVIDSQRRIEFIIDDDEKSKRPGLARLVYEFGEKMDKFERKMVEYETEKRMSKLMYGLGGGTIGAGILKLIDIIFL